MNCAVILICLLGGWLKSGDVNAWFGEKRLGTLASVTMLVAAGVVCLRIGRAIGTPDEPLDTERTSRGGFRWFWLLFSGLLFLVAADDLFRLHERVDRWLHQALGMDPLHPLTDHLDDVIVLAYLLPAGCLALRYRARLLRAHLTIHLLAWATLVFVVHIVFDMLSFPQAAEESLKLIAGCLVLLAFLAAWMDKGLLNEWRHGGTPAL